MSWLVLVWVLASKAAPATPTWEWPLQGRVSSLFGWRTRAGQVRHHDGIDIAADHGTDVVASRVGRVVFVGHRGAYGTTIELSHGRGWTSLYAHLSAATVKEGDLVRQRQPIGKVGSTGRSTGPHLHFEIRHDGQARNPLLVRTRP